MKYYYVHVHIGLLRINLIVIAVVKTFYIVLNYYSMSYINKLYNTFG